MPGHNSEEGQIDGQEVQHQDAVAVQDDQEHVQGVGVDHQQCVVGEDALLSGARGAQLAQDAGGGGHDGEGARVEGGDDGGPQAQATTFMSLRHPEDGVSPGYVKSRRRRRKPDGLVQKQLNSKLFVYKEQIATSVGLNSG